MYTAFHFCDGLKQIIWQIPTYVPTPRPLQLGTVIIGSLLVAADSETHCIPVMNLCPGAWIGDVYPVISLKQAQEVLQADPQLSDSDSDSEDESCWMFLKLIPQI